MITLRPEECAYPFLDQADSRCDWEIWTDRLCSELALAHALLEPAMVSRADLIRWLQDLVYHLNGSVRGRCAVSETELEQLRQYYQELVALNILPAGQPFVLPTGLPAAAQVHVARCSAKQAVRSLHRIEAEGRHIPPLVLRCAGLAANVLSLLALELNRLGGHTEIPFTSRSYGPPSHPA